MSADGDFVREARGLAEELAAAAGEADIVDRFWAAAVRLTEADREREAWLSGHTPIGPTFTRIPRVICEGCGSTKFEIPTEE